MTTRKFRTPNKRRRRDKGSGGLFLRHRKAGKPVWVATVNVREILGEAWHPDMGPGFGGKRGVIERVSVDRDAATHKRDKVIEELSRGVLTQARKKETVETLMCYWLDNIKKPELAPSGLGDYRAIIRNQIVPAIGHVERDKLSSHHVRYLHQWCLDNGYSSRTAQVAYDKLKQAWNDLRREEPPRVRVNPCDAVRRPAADSEVRGSHDTDAARAVLLHARADPFLTRWAAAYMTAARQGECLGLEDDRLDLDKMTMDLSWQLRRLPLRPGADPEDPKRFDVRKNFVHRPVYQGWALTRVKGGKGKSRVVPIAEPLAALFERYMRNRPPNPHGLVWVDTDGHPIDPSDDLERWYALLAAAGQPQITLHGARHTCNSLLQEMGVPEDVRMQITGHSTVTAQRLYQHLSLNAAREALGNLGVLLQAA